MKRNISLQFAVLLCVAFAATSVNAQIDQWGYWQNGVSEPWWFSSAQFTKAQADEGIARWQTIESELQATRSNEWAGTYFSGNETHGSYLRWSAKSGFVIAHVDKCQAKVTGVTYGRVEVSPSMIKLIPEFNIVESQHGSHTTPAGLQFVPVKLAKDQLLVADDEIADFGDYVSGLGKYNSSDLYYTFETAFFTLLRPRGDVQETSSASAPVLIPTGYEQFIKKPIEAKVTRVLRRLKRKTYSYENSEGTGESYQAPVTLTMISIDAGTANGLKAGMFLNVVNPNQNERVRILNADKFSSTGVIVRSIGDNGSEAPFDFETHEPFAKIVAGRKLTTSPF